MRHFLFIAFSLICSAVFSNVTVYFNYAVFSTGNSKPFLETYLTISGNSVRFLPTTGGYQANVNISWKILKGTDVVKASNYNLMSPKTSDTLHLPSFIDNQRFALDNGQYTLELVVTDNASPDKKSTHSEKISILFKREKKVYSSDIQILESYSKASSQSLLTKNGYDLVPYTINYFPKNQHTLKFYAETYNLDTVIGKNTKFVYTYYIENNENLVRQNGLIAFQKHTANKVNPILGQFDITQLPTGNYNLVIEVKDSSNTIQSQKKWFFQRQSNAVNHTEDDLSNSNIKTVEDFFNSFQNRDSLKQFIECLWPRSTTKEREWQQVQTTNKDPNLMRGYLVQYWKTEAGDSLNPLKIWMVYYKSVLEANALMKCGKQQGYYTDRGRVYLQYGKPDQRGQYNSDPTTYPYEVWQYYRIYDKTTGRFFTNKRFVFVNFSIADNCYQLIHSEVRGEMYDEKWKYRLMKRTQKTTNVDDTEPMGSWGSNVDENYNNPR
jgi:GWxTD domain-containing protein